MVLNWCKLNQLKACIDYGSLMASLEALNIVLLAYQNSCELSHAGSTERELTHVGVSSGNPRWE